MKTLACSVENVRHGTTSATGNLINVGGFVILTCTRGFTIDGGLRNTILVYCQQNGNYSTQQVGATIPFPKCLKSKYCCMKLTGPHFTNRMKNRVK